jgi:hypothetical protein
LTTDLNVFLFYFDQISWLAKPVDSELADIVNALFFNGIPESKLSDLLKSVDRPENCNMLTKTRVNQLIWDLLSDYTRGEENKIQYKQGLVQFCWQNQCLILFLDMSSPYKRYVSGTDEEHKWIYSLLRSGLWSRLTNQLTVN